jgi:hypothetical protein
VKTRSVTLHGEKRPGPGCCEQEEYKKKTAMKEETLRRPFVAASQRREKNALLLNKEADFCSTEQPKFTRRGCAHRFVVAIAYLLLGQLHDTHKNPDEVRWFFKLNLFA